MSEAGLDTAGGRPGRRGRFGARTRVFVTLLFVLVPNLAIWVTGLVIVLGGFLTGAFGWMESIAGVMFASSTASYFMLAMSGNANVRFLRGRRQWKDGLDEQRIARNVIIAAAAKAIIAITISIMLITFGSATAGMVTIFVVIVVECFVTVLLALWTAVGLGTRLRR